MTVKELRNGLAAYDDDALVFLADWSDDCAFPTSQISIGDFPAERQEKRIEGLLGDLKGWMAQYGSGPFTEGGKARAERTVAEINNTYSRLILTPRLRNIK